MHENSTQEILAIEGIDNIEVHVTYPENGRYSHIGLFSTVTGEKINQETIHARNKEIAFLDIWEDDAILFVQHVDNIIDFFNITTGTKINRKTIRLQKGKSFETSIMGDDTILFQYTDNQIDVYNKNTGKKINQETIQAEPNKQVEHIAMRGRKTLCIRYADNQVDLINAPSGKKIITVQARYKSFSIMIPQEKNILCIRYPNFYDTHHKKLTDIYTLDNAQKITTIWTKNKKIRNIDTSSINDELLTVLYEDGQQDFFDATSGKYLTTVQQGIFKLIFKRINIVKNVFFITDQEDHIEMFNRRTGEKINTLSIKMKHSVFIVQYPNKDFKLFDTITKQKTEIVTDKDKRYTRWSMLTNFFLVEYKGHGYRYHYVDLFNRFTGEKIYSIPAEHKNIFQHGISNNRIWSLYYRDNTIDLFDIQEKHKISTIHYNSDSPIKYGRSYNNNTILGLQYENRQYDLFYVHNGKLINRSQKIVPRRKRVIKTDIIGNSVFYIKYEDNTHDFFDIHTGNPIINYVPEKAWCVRQKDNTLVAVNHVNITVFNLDESKITSAIAPPTFPGKNITSIKITEDTFVVVTYDDGTYGLHHIDSKTDLEEPIKSFFVKKGILVTKFLDNSTNLYWCFVYPVDRIKINKINCIIFVYDGKNASFIMHLEHSDWFLIYFFCARDIK